MALFSAAVYAPALADSQAREFSIAPGPLGRAINEWSRQTDIQVLYDYTHELQGLRARGVFGPASPLDALSILLRDTPYKFDVINARTVAILRGVPVCQPELGAAAPLPPCVAAPAARAPAAPLAPQVQL